MAQKTSITIRCHIPWWLSPGLTVAAWLGSPGLGLRIAAAAVKRMRVDVI